MKKIILFASYLIVFEKGYTQVDITEQLINTTIKIVGLKDSLVNGKIEKYQSIGTGFYFNFVKGTDTIPVIVTNAHVISKCHTGYLRFKSYGNGKVNYGDLLSIKIENFEKKWIKHGSEDLAILPLMPIKDETYRLYKKIPFSISFSESDIPPDSVLNNLLAIEDVLMLGYPRGLADEVNDLPIVRNGLTATPVFLDYQGKQRFLLDIPIYPGSSGSPICLLNQGSYATKKGGIVLGSRFYLLGIAVQSNNYTAIGVTVAKDSIPSLEVKTELPYEVAVVIKAKKLFDFKPILFK